MQAAPNVFCLDFDDLGVGPAPAPHTFGPFTTGSRDPLDRAEWDVVAMGASPPNAGRLTVAMPDGGPAFAVGGAMEVGLPELPKRIDCTLQWRVVRRAPKTSTTIPETFALLTLFYTDGADRAVRIALVTSTGGEAALYQPTLPAASQMQMTPLPNLEGVGWRQATVVFDTPAPGNSGFVQVKGPAGPAVDTPITLAETVKDVHLLIGADEVSTHPWEVLFDDIRCTTTP